MNYTLDLNTQEPNSNIVFNTIIFDSFKVNVVERYLGRMDSHPRLCHVLFKVRTLDNDIIKTRAGHGRVKVKGDLFDSYQKLIKVLNSYEYKNKLLNRQEAEQDYVHFILSLVIVNYQLN
ncbi:MAG: prevent-host-death protein [Chryseobacterium sp.]|uniref:prevent-host-death protein n=1 Tax=Chryseobacterium sp. TaxID=1871047 RepID=UPI0025C44E37|nr:prevent-host-death protein [Chryseobacterium sp.]MCJ7932289.1 prevent-host-death protein [Chryseobacterium sp.]